MVRALVVYYSSSGTTKQVADVVVAELQKNNITTVVEVIKCTKAEGVGMARQGFRCLTGSKYVLDNPPQNDPREFEFVLFGSPVWAFNVNPILDEWLKAAQFDPIKTNFGAFIQCMGTKFEKTFTEIEKITGKPLAAKTPVFSKEVKKSPEIVAKKIEDLVKGVIQGGTAQPAENVVEGAVAKTEETKKEDDKPEDVKTEEAKTE